MLKIRVNAARLTVTVVALIAVGLHAAPARASLIGDLVTGVEHYDGFIDNYFSVGSGGSGDSAVVGAGLEFSTANFAFPVHADLDAFDLVLTHANTGGGAGAANGFTVDLGSLDFGGGLVLVGVNLVSNGFSTLTFSFTPDSLHVDVDPYQHPAGEVSARFEFVTRAVPEPATFGLLGLGLAGLGLIRRKS